MFDPVYKRPPAPTTVKIDPNMCAGCYCGVLCVLFVCRVVCGVCVCCAPRNATMGFVLTIRVVDHQQC